MSEDQQKIIEDLQDRCDKLESAYDEEHKKLSVLGSIIDDICEKININRHNYPWW